jgi:Glycine zipper
MRHRIIAALAAAGLLVGGCQNLTPAQQGAATGGTLGAVAGGLLGSLSGNAGWGALIGAAAGGTGGYLVERGR